MFTQADASTPLLRAVRVDLGIRTDFEWEPTADGGARIVAPTVFSDEGYRREYISAADIFAAATHGYTGLPPINRKDYA